MLHKIVKPCDIVLGPEPAALPFPNVYCYTQVESSYILGDFSRQSKRMQGLSDLLISIFENHPSVSYNDAGICHSII